MCPLQKLPSDQSNSGADVVKCTTIELVRKSELPGKNLKQGHIGLERLILDSESWSQWVKESASTRSEGVQGLGLQEPSRSRGRPTRSQGVKGQAYGVPGG